MQLLAAFALEVVQGHPQVVLADDLVEALGTFLLDWSQLAGFLAIAIAELDFLFGLC